MSTQSLIAMIAGMLLVTFGVRYVLLAFGERLQLPDMMSRALHYVPVAVLSAITLPMIVQPGGELTLNVSSPYLAAGLAATLTAVARAPLIVTIVGGMAIFYLWRFAFS